MTPANDLVSIRPIQLFATVAAAIFVGITAAFIARGLFDQPSAQATEPALETNAASDSTSSASDSRLAAAVLQLVKELRDARAASPSVPGVQESSQRSVVTDSGGNAIAELAAAIHELSGALHGSSALPGTGAQPLVRPANPQRRWLDPLPDFAGNRSDEQTRRHLFWTEQQVIDQYGLPDGIGSNGSGFEAWNYNDSEPNGRRGFTMKFSRGRVIGVESR